MRDREGQLVAGRYRVGARLGGGGIGTVWRATDEFLEREVAIKEVTLFGEVEVSTPAFQRTLREARASARLRHPNIVIVYDVALEFGRPWIVMERIDGPSLAEVVERDGPLSDQRAVDVARQLLAALASTHAQGVLHRDVKPANVLVEGDRVVLTDFGIAAVEGGTALTATNQLVGSPQYLSPERINGLGAGPASDLWALGVTLYVAVTGASPFQREDTQAVLAAVLTQDPPPVSGALGPVIAGLLRKDPAARLTAADAAALLDKDQLGKDQKATKRITPDPAPRQRVGPLGKGSHVAITLAAVIALATAAILWVVWPPPGYASGLDRMADRGSVAIGVLEDQPGLSFYDSVSDSYVGFDVEIAKLIADKLGFGEDKIVFTPVDAAGREDALTSGKVDMVVGAYPITEESKRRVSFAGPYLTSAPTLLLRDGESLGPTSMRGHKVCTRTKSASAQELRNSGQVEPSDIVLRSSWRDCVDELVDHRVDAVVSDEIVLAGWAAMRSDLYDVLVYSTTSVTYGIGMAHDDKPLRDKANDILNDALDDGTWREIYDRTLGSSGAEPGIPTVEGY